MRVLADTHAMLWWLRDDQRLSRRARQLLGDGASDLLWSIASCWEIAVKPELGKMEIDKPLPRLFADLVSEQGVTVLPVGHEHCALLAVLPLHHRDPFDRMLVIQAMHERVPILTADPKPALYRVELIWQAADFADRLAPHGRHPLPQECPSRFEPVPVRSATDARGGEHRENEPVGRPPAGSPPRLPGRPKARTFFTGILASTRSSRASRLSGPGAGLGRKSGNSGVRFPGRPPSESGEGVNRGGKRR